MITIYSTDFEQGLSGWQRAPSLVASVIFDNLWQVDGTPERDPVTFPEGPAYSGSKSLNYNNGRDYSTDASMGPRNWGSVSSPRIQIGWRNAFRIRFQCNYRTETTGTGDYDKRFFQLSMPGRPSLRFVRVQLSADGREASLVGPCGPMGIWHTHEFEIAASEPAAPDAAPFPGIPHEPRQNITVNLSFDSGDAVANFYPGWFIDDFSVVAISPDPPPPPPPPGDDHSDIRERGTPLVVDWRPIDGRIERAGDRDFFRITTVPHATFPAMLTVRTLGLSPANMDTWLHVYDRDGKDVPGSPNDDGGGGWASQIPPFRADNGPYFAMVRHYYPDRTGAYKIEVRSVDLPPDDHGNTPQTATQLALNAPPLNGAIEMSSDVDFFQIVDADPVILVFPPPSVTYVIETFGLSATMDTVIHLYDNDGKQLGFSDDEPGQGWASRIEWTTGAEPRPLFVKVRHYSSSNGTGTYSIRVTKKQ